MVAIIAMLIGYLIWSDLRVVIYIGVGFAAAKWLYESFRKND